jgi:glutamyl-tRNA reductase
MEIAVVGISHKEADVLVRGRAAFTTATKKDATEAFRKSGLTEFMIISTCNRSEIYIATKDMKRDVNIVKDYYLKLAGPSIEPYLFTKKYEVALQHIYQVATGLHSLIIGEDEILGQMKRALEFAIEHDTSKKYLSKVVREAITFSKKIRNAYKLSESQLSVASIGISHLKDYYGDIKDKHILLIGTGVMGQLILRYLEAEKNPNIYLTNRTVNKDKIQFYLDKSIHVIEYDQRYDIINDMDIVISATSSPHTILFKDKLPILTKEITFLDMAVPRDIEPAIDGLDNANVITLDDFDKVASEHMKKRHELAVQINRLILEEVKELELWILSTKVDGVIKEFHAKQERILSEHIVQLNKLELPKEKQQEVIELLRRSTWQMIKEPVEQLKKLKEVEDIDHYKMIIENLFDFDSADK